VYVLTWRRHTDDVTGARAEGSASDEAHAARGGSEADDEAATSAGERFFDAEVTDRRVAPRLLLERHQDEGVETFGVLRKVGFDDPDLGTFVVPADSETFRSDLTSVPALFTWLVPRTGNHLPAAILHDGLVHDDAEPASYIGPTITREQADLVFRNAMADLGTERVRRWLIWTAVALATALTSTAKGGMQPRWRWFSVVAGTLAAVVALGVLATIDVFDGCTILPWMGDRVWWRELAGGAAGAIVIPAALALAWGRLWRAGLIACITLALLLHATVVLAVLTTLFQFVESPSGTVASVRRAVRLPVIAGLVAFAGVIVAVLWWRCP